MKEQIIRQVRVSGLAAFSHNVHKIGIGARTQPGNKLDVDGLMELAKEIRSLELAMASDSASLLH